MERFSHWPWPTGANKPRPRTREEIVALVYEILRRRLDLKDGVLAPSTDLVQLAQQGDPEDLEWALEALEDAFEMKCPEMHDDNGHVRRAQLFLPDHLTVSDLTDSITRGAWPEDWTREGQWVR